MDALHKGTAVALRFIANRMKTEAEIKRKLRTKNYDHISEQIIAALKAKGYVDDENYITCYIKDRINFNPMGRLRIKRELEQRGIEKMLIENNGEYKSIDEKALIDSLLNTKLADYDLNDNKDLRKIFAYLARRGFEYDNINSALKTRRT